mgnify:FL=1
MEKTRKIRCFTTFIILIILIIILLIMNVCIGTVHISFKAAFATLYDHSDRVGRIVWDIRMPRAIAAMILGGALALAGYLLQTFFIIQSRDLLCSAYHREPKWSWHLLWYFYLEMPYV